MQAEDSPLQWEDEHFASHFLFGNGAPVFLQETGHLDGIIQYYFYTHGAYNRANSQIISEARNYERGAFEYHFYNRYEFEPYVYSIGGAVVTGTFRGNVSQIGDMMLITGMVDYVFSDVFTDPFGQRQRSIGTSDPEAATPEMLEETEYGGTYYAINGYWQTNFYAEAKLSEEASRYR